MTASMKISIYYWPAAMTMLNFKLIVEMESWGATVDTPQWWKNLCRR